MSRLVSFYFDPRYGKSLAVVQDRLWLAGMRLAGMLNALFGDDAYHDCLSGTFQGDPREGRARTVHGAFK